MEKLSQRNTCNRMERTPTKISWLKNYRFYPKRRAVKNKQAWKCRHLCRKWKCRHLCRKSISRHLCRKWKCRHLRRKWKCRRLCRKWKCRHLRRKSIKRENQKILTQTQRKHLYLKQPPKTDKRINSLR